MLEKAYLILGVNKDSDINTIKKIFREKVKKFHPDVNPDISDEKFREIVDSYNVIINTRSRKIDLWSNIEELYFYIIRNFLKDIYIELNNDEFINIDTISYYFNEYCEVCSKSENLPCMKCHGKGYNMFKTGDFFSRVICQNCFGRGKIFLCKKCNGEGKRRIKNELDIKKFKKISNYLYKAEGYGNKYKDYCSDVYIKII